MPVQSEALHVAALLKFIRVKLTVSESFTPLNFTAAQVHTLNESCSKHQAAANLSNGNEHIMSSSYINIFKYPQGCCWCTTSLASAYRGCATGVRTFVQKAGQVH